MKDNKVYTLQSCPERSRTADPPAFFGGSIGEASIDNIL